MDPWINAMSTKKPRTLVTGCTKNMQQQQEMSTQEFILKIKFDKDSNKNSKDMKMIFIVFIQKQDGHTISLQLPRALLLHHLGGNHPTAGGQHGIGILHHCMNNRFLVSDGRIFAYKK